MRLTDTDIPPSIPVIEYIVFITPSIQAVPSFQPDLPYPGCSRKDAGCFSWHIPSVIMIMRAMPVRDRKRAV